jgi:hypothetical protein
MVGTPEGKRYLSRDMSPQYFERSPFCGYASSGFSGIHNPCQTLIFV